MYPCFDVDGLSVERLLADWKWLAPEEFSLVAVNSFGDLFLQDVRGAVNRLDITEGTVSAVAASSVEFQEAAKDTVRKREWFLEELAEQAEQKGCSPGKGQCIGCKIPWVFKESKDMLDNIYVADLYEYLSFMGDLHEQIKDVPDGGQIRLKVQARPHKSDPLKD